MTRADDAPPTSGARLAGPTASSPSQIKALTHPLRLRILGLFDSEPELTATQCARLTGESVASCSFHLRQLEKYGFVVRGEARGKERPWRSVGGFSVIPDLADPGALDAAQALGRLHLAGEFQRLLAWVDGAGSEDPSWFYASTQTSASFWATREELDALSREVERLSEGFSGRSAHPELRPDGARLCRLFAAANADLVPDVPHETDEVAQ